VDEAGERNPELERILEAERQARGTVEAARAEASRIEEEARRLAAERTESARAACAARREEARAVTVERAEPELARIRAEGNERCQRLAAAARQGMDAAVDAAEAALLGAE
jgi:vacuolar-type H+-ATPase subunit H